MSETLNQAASPAPWADVVPEDDLRVYQAAGFGRPGGFGRRPALLVIDTQYRTVGQSRRPILEAITEYPTACGETGWRAIDHIATLLALFRRLQLPVIYPHVAPKTVHDGGRFAAKVPGIMSVDSKGYEFVPAVAPRPEDILLPKHHPSAFFGTPLASHLVNQRVDSLVITGCTTSGCIRASVVDAFSLNYPVMVPIECVYDRSTVSHKVNLFDMSSKYADVLPLADVMGRLSEIAGRAA